MYTRIYHSSDIVFEKSLLIRSRLKIDVKNEVARVLDEALPQEAASDVLIGLNPIPKELIDITADYGLKITRDTEDFGYIHYDTFRIRRKDMPNTKRMYVPRKICLAPIADPDLERAIVFHEIGHAVNTIANNYQIDKSNELIVECAAWQTGFNIARKYGYDFKKGSKESQFAQMCVDSYIVNSLEDRGIVKVIDHEYDEIYEDVLYEKTPSTKKGNPPDVIVPSVRKRIFPKTPTTKLKENEYLINHITEES